MILYLDSVLSAKKFNQFFECIFGIIIYIFSDVDRLERRNWASAINTHLVAGLPIASFWMDSLYWPTNNRSFPAEAAILWEPFFLLSLSAEDPFADVTVEQAMASLEDEENTQDFGVHGVRANESLVVPTHPVGGKRGNNSPSKMTGLPFKKRDTI